MNYLCLVYYDESKVEAMSEEEWLALNYECVEFGKSIDRSGHRRGGAALEPTRTAVTVRVRDGQTTITDGPFAETREQLAGFYLIDAENLDEAIRTASGIPPARFGSIEIRPVRELPTPPAAADGR